MNIDPSPAPPWTSISRRRWHGDLRSAQKNLLPEQFSGPRRGRPNGGQSRVSFPATILSSQSCHSICFEPPGCTEPQRFPFRAAWSSYCCLAQWRKEGMDGQGGLSTPWSFHFSKKKQVIAKLPLYWLILNTGLISVSHCTDYKTYDQHL